MRFAVGALVGAALSVTALAQSGAPAPAAPAPASDDPASPIAAEEARGAALDLARTLEENYVFPEIARNYAATLREKTAAGAYDGLGTAGAFAERVSADLRAVSPDNHLRLHVARVPEGGGPVSIRRPALAGGPAGAPAPRRPTQAIEEQRWLAPGIAYIRFTGFPRDEAVTKAAQAFMADHAEAETLIFDIRTHGGGGLDQMDAIFPYLFAKPTPLVTMDTRAAVEAGRGGPLDDSPTLTREVAGDDIVRRVHRAIPHPSETRLFDARVFVLTSGFTASAAEHFALAMKRSGRATLIGTSTGGAGHYGGLRPIGRRFAAFVPVGRTYDPDTGKGWEGDGVAPHVAVPAERALAEALLRSGLSAAEADRIAAEVKVEGSMERRRRG
ncbi:hypothetical protein E2493_10705 [Sphingomonas parva]|uniref:Tail specific protease domain-containing protein n=1 Tax=Sphingomonas parva TaxID=2555898 RepID=A0A4Y8ZSI0_9SPHN|nr:S41 family peptidase [Sphingomonas parva]TFI58252.1 hypothetical protein E2493_10705 [Sphingomonas parva]